MPWGGDVTLRMGPRPTRPPRPEQVNDQGRFPDLRIGALPGLPGAGLRQWHVGQALRLQLRGQFRIWPEPDRIPFYPGLPPAP